MTPKSNPVCIHCLDEYENHVAATTGHKCLWQPDFFKPASCLFCDSVIQYSWSLAPVVTLNNCRHALHRLCYEVVRLEADLYGGWVKSEEDAITYLLRYK